MLFPLLLLLSFPAVGWAQGNGAIAGKVTLGNQRTPVHNVIVIITQLKRSTLTDEQGSYEFKDVPAGAYTLVARLDRIPDVVARVEVTSGTTQAVDFELKLTGVREQVTVSALGNEQTAFESFQGVTGLDATALQEQSAASLGEALERQTGITKRSSGPGSSRPVIRGFDGDRVLIAQDGIRSGSLSYASGDHGEPVNVLSLERVEVVRGAATLLYGSSAIGGMVNAVSGHEQPHAGWRGYASVLGNTNAPGSGGSGGLEFGTQRWLFWGGGGVQDAGDYRTPLGKLENSGYRYYDFNGGSGIYGKRAFFNVSYRYNHNIYEVPLAPDHDDEEEKGAAKRVLPLHLFPRVLAKRQTSRGALTPTGVLGGEGPISLNPRSHGVRFTGGVNELRGAFDHAHFTFDWNDYKHEELIGGEPETRFFNRTYSYRAIAEQKRFGTFSGTLGVSGFQRNFKVLGDEALVPPTTQNSFAVFGVEQVDLRRVAFQFGGRVERNAYDTTPSATRRNRAFTGFSGAAGVRVPVWEGGAVALNYTHSYRAPSLDELYNYGPHPGNFAFEIGNTNLRRERGDGIDLSFRQTHQRVRVEAHYFYNRMQDFVFLAPTTEVEDGFTVAQYLQGDARYTGAELDLNVNLHNTTTLTLGADSVNAKLTASGTPLPRIPPVRLRAGLDFNWKGLRLYPELVTANRQTRVFTNETPTAGWATLNVLAGYTYATQHLAHLFSVNAFNLNNKLYFNHLSFLKAFAPEVGRGVRISYTVRFF